MQCCWTHWTQDLTLGRESSRSKCVLQPCLQTLGSANGLSSREASGVNGAPSQWPWPLSICWEAWTLQCSSAKRRFYSLAAKQSSQCWDSTYLHVGAQQDKKLCMTRLERLRPHNTQCCTAFNTGQVTRHFSFFKVGHSGTTVWDLHPILWISSIPVSRVNC